MFELRGKYEFSSPDIVHEDFEGEYVILNLASGTYYALNPTASQLVASLLQGVAVEELSSLHGTSFRAEDVQAFLTELLNLELIVATPDTPAAPLPESLRRESRSWSEAPTVEVYDDLADLILADPIHDTDSSVGWPALPDGDQMQKRAA